MGYKYLDIDMTEETLEQKIAKGLAESHEDIVSRITENMIQRASATNYWEFEQLTKKTIQQFYEDEIAPELVKKLTAQKGEIMKGVERGAVGIGTVLASSMIKNAEDALTGYGSGDILKNLVAN